MLTGFNTAFVIDEPTRMRLIEADPKSAELIKPLVKGKDVRKWHIEDKKRYLIFARRGIKIEDYPAVLAHLEQYRERLEPKPKDWPHGKPWNGRKPGRYKWYELQDDIAYFREFDKPKIIYPDITQEARFILDYSGSYILNTVYMIVLDDKYLLGILNSKIFWDICLTYLSGLGREGRRFFKQDLERMPIPLPSDSQRKEMEKLVSTLIESNDDSEIKDLEDKIESLATTIYGIKP